MPAVKLSITLPEELRETIIDRAAEDTSLSGQIQDDIGLIYSLLGQLMKYVYPILSKDEAQLILDVQNGAFWDHTQVFSWLHGGLAHNVSDGIALDRLDEKWSIDGRALLDKLNAFDNATTIAVLDWARHMWRHCDVKGYWDEELKKFRG